MDGTLNVVNIFAGARRAAGVFDKLLLISRDFHIIATISRVQRDEKREYPVWSEGADWLETVER